MRRLLNEWKKKGLIKGYDEVKKGRSYVGVVVYIAQVDEIADKQKTNGE